MAKDVCYGCGLGVETVMPTLMVYPTTSQGDIAFCEVCFERRNFGDLTIEDIETVTWFFATSYVEDEPARAVTLLEPLLERWHSPDLLSPLGRAYVRVGRLEEGKALLREALEMNPRHPYVAHDKEILGGG